MSANYTVMVTVGIIYVRWFRYKLKAMKFAGHDVEFMEGPGRFDRDFTIKCDEYTSQYLKKLISEINEEQPTKT